MFPVFGANAEPSHLFIGNEAYDINGSGKGAREIPNEQNFMYCHVARSQAKNKVLTLEVCKMELAMGTPLILYAKKIERELEQIRSERR